MRPHDRQAHARVGAPKDTIRLEEKSEPLTRVVRAPDQDQSELAQLSELRGRLSQGALPLESGQKRGRRWVRKHLDFLRLDIVTREDSLSSIRTHRVHSE